MDGSGIKTKIEVGDLIVRSIDPDHEILVITKVHRLNEKVWRVSYLTLGGTAETVDGDSVVRCLDDDLWEYIGHLDISSWFEMMKEVQVSNRVGLRGVKSNK